MKKEISLKMATRLLSSGNVVLLSCAYMDKVNIITIAWKSPLSHNPPLVGVSVAKTHFSRELIEKSEEFVINIPDHSLLRELIFCGKHSGRDVDKIGKTKFNLIKANKLNKAPLLSKCIGHIECCVQDKRAYGDHIFFVGEMICAQAEEDLFDETWNVNKAKIVYHLGGQFFAIPEKRIDASIE